MNTECERSTPKKWRKSPSWKTENSIVKPKKERKEEPVDKENRGVVVPKQRQRKKETLKNVSNLSTVLPSTFSKEGGQIPNHKGTCSSRSPQPHLAEQSHRNVLASTPTNPVKSSFFLEELRAVTSRLQKLSFDKERTEKLLNERDALLKQQEAELEIKAKAQERLELELQKLYKLKEFKAALCKHSYPLEQSLRMVELSKEQDKENKINDSNRLKETSLPYNLCCQDQPYQSMVQPNEQENEEDTDPNRPKKPQTPFLVSRNWKRQVRNNGTIRQQEPL